MVQSEPKPIDILIQSGPFLRALITLPSIAILLGASWFLAGWFTTFTSTRISLFSGINSFVLTFALIWVYVKIAEENMRQTRLMQQEHEPDLRATVDFRENGGPIFLVQNIGRDVAVDVGLEWEFNGVKRTYEEPFLSQDASLQFSLLDHDLGHIQEDELVRLSDFIQSIDTKRLSYKLKYNSKTDTGKAADGELNVPEAILAHSSPSYAASDDTTATVTEKR